MITIEARWSSLLTALAVAACGGTGSDPSPAFDSSDTLTGEMKVEVLNAGGLCHWFGRARIVRSGDELTVSSSDLLPGPSQCTTLGDWSPDASYLGTIAQEGPVVHLHGDCPDTHCDELMGTYRDYRLDTLEGATGKCRLTDVRLTVYTVWYGQAIAPMPSLFGTASCVVQGRTYDADISVLGDLPTGWGSLRR